MAARVLQLDLFRGGRPAEARKPEPRDWSREASDFFAKHPEVIDRFCAIALDEADGRNYLSAKMVWEECRLHFGPRGIACNNNYCATAAAIARARHPELARKLRTRGRT